MRILWHELKKITRQSLGTENIFGYRSTVANQLYLLYCFCGKIYFTDKVDKRVKYLWYSLVSSQLIFSCVLGWSYLWYDDKNDLVLMLNMSMSIGCIHTTTLGFPFILYLFSDRIEAMIDFVDGLMNVKFQNTVLKDVKKYFSFFFTSLFVCVLVFLLASFLDVILFFEEDKVSIYAYYAYPPPMVQKYSSFGSFMMATGVTGILFVVITLEVWLVFALMLYWSIICCSQLTSVKDGLHARTCDLNQYSDTEIALSQEWRGIFECTLKRSIREFQMATRLINYMRGYVESICTILFIALFCYGVALLYACLSNDMPLLLKVKCCSGYIASIMEVFLFYLIGQNLDITVSEVSLAVYSTPWYRSVKIRKTVNILLCQTQSTKNLATFRVYGLLFRNFSRYMHTLVSYTNILRRLTN